MRSYSAVIVMLALAFLVLAAPGVRADAGAPLSPEDAQKELARLGFALSKKSFFGRLEAGDVRAVQLMLAAGMDTKTRDAGGRPPLYRAVDAGNAAMVQALLAAGANPNDAGAAADERMESGATLIMQAVDGRDVDVLKALIAAGADVNKGNDWKVNGLMSAARQGKTGMVEALIQGGANVNAVDSAGTPVLFGPVIEGNAEMVSLLLHAGAKMGVGRQRKILLDAAKKPEIQKLLKAAS